MTKEQKIIRAKVGLLELASSLRKFRLPIFEMRPSFATRGVLLGRQPEKDGELARAGEAGCILNGRRHRRGR